MSCDILTPFCHTNQPSDHDSRNVTDAVIFDHVVEQNELIPAAARRMHQLSCVDDETESSPHDTDGTRHSVPGKRPCSSSGSDDGISVSATAVHCECFDRTDNDWSNSFTHLRDNVTSGHVTHLKCRRCGRAWPTDDGGCYVGIGYRRRVSVVLRPEVLRLGDHVTWTRAVSGIPYRHGIVIGVDAAQRGIRLISFQRKPRDTVREQLEDNGKNSEPPAYGQVRSFI